MKHFIVEDVYTAPLEQIEAAVAEHRRFLQSGYQRGWLLCSGPQVPRQGGVIVARAPSLADIQRFFADDPFQKKGLATYRFIEFEPLTRQPFLEDWVTG